MQGKWTKMYYDQKKITLEYLKEKLKDRLNINKGSHETPKEILVQFSHIVYRCKSQLVESTRSNSPKRRSWFKREIIERFKYDKDRYKDGFQLDGFLENIVPQIQKDFKYHFNRADNRAIDQEFYDKAFADNPSYEKVVKLLSLDAAYASFLQKGNEILAEAQVILAKEKKLVTTNRFNHLRPVKVLDYFMQLNQINPDNKEPFLTKQQVYDLTNMICRNQEGAKSVTLNISKDQKKYIIRFIYEFYRYCKDTGDSKGSREKYITILTNYFAQFSSPDSSRIYPENFYIKQPDSPIKVDDEYKRWMNA